MNIDAIAGRWKRYRQISPSSVMLDEVGNKLRKDCQDAVKHMMAKADKIYLKKSTRFSSAVCQT